MKTASDILEAVHFVKYNDLKIAVTNTGHSVALPENDDRLMVFMGRNRFRHKKELSTHL